ncbi:MAG: J domain-containing protein [Deltaproteobacteria bacterium]|nr:J domain-containing protein [Deltaproteobacteria bacterium]
MYLIVNTKRMLVGGAIFVSLFMLARPGNLHAAKYDANCADALADFHPNSNDFWKRLGLKPGASPDEIDRAYRLAAMKFHPDRNPGKEKEAKKKFVRIQEAWEGLKNGKRSSGDNGENDTAASPARAAEPHRPSTGTNSAKDIFDAEIESVRAEVARAAKENQLDPIQTEIATVLEAVFQRLRNLSNSGKAKIETEIKELRDLVKNKFFDMQKTLFASEDHLLVMNIQMYFDLQLVGLSRAGFFHGPVTKEHILELMDLAPNFRPEFR